MGNDFAGVRTRPKDTMMQDDFAGVRTRPKMQASSYQEPQQQGDSWLSFVGKSIAKGLGSIGDIPHTIGLLTEMGGNYAYNKTLEDFNKKLAAKGLPPIPQEEFISEPTNYSSYIPNTTAARKHLKNYTGVDLEPHASSPDMEVLGNALEFGSGLVGLGGGAANKVGEIAANKASQSLIKNFASKAANKTRQLAPTAALGAGIGATAKTLEQTGVDPLTANLAPTIAFPFAGAGLSKAKNAGKTLANKAQLKVLGLSPKGLKLDAAKAAKELGIELPASALTDSRLTGFADQVIGKTPFFGDNLKRKYSTADEQTKRAIDQILNEVGPAETEAIKAQRAQLYADRDKLAQGVNIAPTKTNQSTQALKAKLEDADIKSPETQKVLNALGKLQGGFTEYIDPKWGNVSNLLKLPPKEISANRMIGNKKNLYDISYDKNDNNWATVKDLLKPIARNINQDIKEAGKTHPEFYKAHVAADELAAKIFRRKRLEELLTGRGVNERLDEVSYSGLSGVIHNPKSAREIKNLVGKETFEKIEKLGDVARAMAQKTKNVPNPSGTTATAAIPAFLAGFWVSPPTAIGSLIGTTKVTQLLTDQKFLDMAIKYAEKPSIINGMSLNKRIQKITGQSAAALNQAISKQNANKKEEK
jgi:hypothetical protein